MKKNIARQICENIYKHAMHYSEAWMECLIFGNLAEYWEDTREDGTKIEHYQYADGSTVRLYTLDQYLCYDWQKDNKSNPHRMPILFK